jgi:hypothetical protein
MVGILYLNPYSTHRPKIFLFVVIFIRSSSIEYVFMLLQNINLCDINHCCGSGSRIYLNPDQQN